MLVSKSSFKLSAIECTSEFLKFAKYFGIYDEAAKNLKKFVACPTFNMKEESDPLKHYTDKYEKAVTICINKLFTLDRAFYKKENLHIVARLETFEGVKQALEEIERICISESERERENEDKDCK